MAKSREKIQQLGFWDTEVSKPDHDAVCLWAYEHADLIFRAVCPDRFDRVWLKSELDFDSRSSQDVNLLSEFKNANPRPNPRVTRRTLECVLTSYTGYQDKMERIVGYADVLINTEVPRVSPKFKADTTRRGHDVFEGYEIRWTGEREVAPRILVEAKSTLPTVGELMRQIQLYRTAFNGEIVVVSPDDSYAKILAEQGVKFVKYGESGSAQTQPAATEP